MNAPLPAKKRVRFHDWECEPTTAAVYHALLEAHGPTWGIHSSYTDTERGRIETTFGLRGADYPLVGVRSTWTPNHAGRHEYFLIVAKQENS